ncbi:MAG: hypothetical protein WAM94_16430, partial [Chromatiaceae bacterium]
SADDDSPSSYSVSLIDVCAEPAEAIERAMATFYDDDVVHAGLFNQVRQHLARISHANERIGAPNQRELLCCNDFALIRGEPRCRQSVAQKDLILEPWKVALWKPHLMVAWSRRMRERCFWERPIGRLI